MTMGRHQPKGSKSLGKRAKEEVIFLADGFEPLDRSFAQSIKGLIFNEHGRCTNLEQMVESYVPVRKFDDAGYVTIIDNLGIFMGRYPHVVAPRHTH